jgi:hypothetical protein
MTEELAHMFSLRPAVIEIQMPPVEPPAPADAVTHLTPEQIQVREAVLFQQAQDQESHQVAALLGIWTGTLLLRDLAIEHFSELEEDEEEKPDLPSEPKA